MNELRCFFNLIAILIAKARQFEAYRRMQTISDDEAVRVKDFVDGIIFLNFNLSVKDVKKRLSITEKDVEEILEALKDKHFYYFSALITRLDKLLSSELLYDWLKPNPLSGDSVSDNYFESLNNNAEQNADIYFPEYSRN